jgi:hypothetical protein
VKDGTTAAPTNSPTEVDATNAPGVYKLVLTAAECTCDFGTLAGKSSAASVSIIPVSVAFEQLPTALPGASGGVPTLDAGLRVKADLERWLAATPDALISGKVPANVQALATAVITSSAFAVDAIDALALKADAGQEIADQWLDRASAIEGYSPRQLLRLVAAVLLGKASGLGGTTAVYRDPADTKDRVTATVDSDGNRSAVVLDAA